MNKKILGAVAAVFLIFVAAYLASPFLAARQFREAARSGDIDQLETAVDFPLVRESLKAQMTVAITAKMANDPEMRSNPFAGLGTMMMPVIIGKAVDSFVTPDGISALVKRGRMEQGSESSDVNSDVKYSYKYRSLDRFVVSAQTDSTRFGEGVKFVFDRRGIFSWKMVRLEVSVADLSAKH